MLLPLLRRFCGRLVTPFSFDMMTEDDDGDDGGVAGDTSLPHREEDVCLESKVPPSSSSPGTNISMVRD